MNNLGYRRPGSGSLNGWLGNLSYHKEYMGCVDQAGVAQRQMGGMSTDDKWTFSINQESLGFHKNVIGISSNPNDPMLIIDTWRNSFEERPR